MAKIIKKPAPIKTSPVKKSTPVKKSVADKKPVKVVKKATVTKPVKTKTASAPKKQVSKKQNKNKTRYSLKDLQYFKDLLINEKQTIIQSARANMRSLVDQDSGDYVGDDLSYASHMAEQGTDEMEREKNYMFVQRDEKYLGYIEEALTRIEQGTYGICIDCMEEPKYLCKTCPLIPKDRLEIVPITQHCIECKNIRG